MNNKMAINTYLSTTESKKQTKQTSRTETESWIKRVFLFTFQFKIIKMSILPKAIYRVNVIFIKIPMASYLFKKFYGTKKDPK